MAVPINQTHGRYALKAGKLGGQFVARAFLAGAKTGAGMVAEAQGATADAALADLITQLDQRDSDLRGARRHMAEVPVDIPSPAEFTQALAAVAVTPGQRAMLKAHAIAGDKGLSANELADAAGYAQHESANLHYGKLGKMIAVYLGIDLPPSATRKGDTVATYMLATGIGTVADRDFRWIIHPELAAAVNEAA